MFGASHGACSASGKMSVRFRFPIYIQYFLAVISLSVFEISTALHAAGGVFVCLQFKSGISTARGELKIAESMRKRRNELNAICAEVLKRPSLKETNQLEREEAERRIKAETTTADIVDQIANKKRQVVAAIKAAGDLFEISKEKTVTA